MTIDEIIELCNKSKEIGCASNYFGFDLNSDIFLEKFPKETWTKVEKYEQDDGSVRYWIFAEHNGVKFNTRLYPEQFKHLCTSHVTYVPEKEFEYVLVKLDDKAVVQIKRGDEGYVLDVYGKDYDTEEAEPVASTYVFYNELEGDEEDASENS